MTLEELCDDYLCFLKDKNFVIRITDWYEKEINQENKHLLIYYNDDSGALRKKFNINEVEDELIPFLIRYKELFNGEVLFYLRLDEIKFNINDILNGIPYYIECDAIAIKLKII